MYGSVVPLVMLCCKLTRFKALFWQTFVIVFVIVIDLLQSVLLFGKLHNCLSDLKIAWDKITCEKVLATLWLLTDSLPL